MAYLPDMKYMLFQTSTSTASFAARSIVGRVHLYGVYYTPRVAAGSSTSIRGVSTVEFWNLNSDLDGKGSDNIFTFPLMITQKYTADAEAMFGDRHGYVLFDNGLYIDETQVATALALDFVALTLYYA
tara:strand:+ start:82 stop:465 length:384 start_codon:yes stop_codon:yes gene_type:complete